MTKIKYFIPAGLILLGFLFYVAVATGAVSFSIPTKSNQYDVTTLLSATTTSATSTNLAGGGGYAVIAGAKKVEFYFTHGGTATTSTGTSTFSVQVSDATITTWHNFNKLVQNLATSTYPTTVSSVGITGATSTKIVALDLSADTFYAARCEVNEGTPSASGDGEHTCSVGIEY